jgi:hypothetical protein
VDRRVAADLAWDEEAGGGGDVDVVMMVRVLRLIVNNVGRVCGDVQGGLEYNYNGTTDMNEP